MKKLLLAGAAVVVIAVTSVAAQAGTITISGGTAGTIPSGGQTNEALPVFGISNTGPGYGYYGSQITSTDTNFRIDYIGAEAGFRNQFQAPGGTTLFTTPGGGSVFGTLAAPLATAVLTNINPGLGTLNFRFVIDSVAANFVANGSNPFNVGVLANFFSSLNPNSASAGRVGNSVYLFLDDGGAGPDDNHDDMVIRITAIPEPTSMAILGAGLLGLGFVRRRRAAKAEPVAA